jgi:branched-chain amino acid transport system substrate-binding protein
MPEKVTRRSYLTLAGAAGATALAGCSATTGGDSGPIRIGSAVPLSGPLSSYGERASPGVEFVRTQIGDTILDREYEVVTRDTQTDPATGLEVVRELVEEENVDALMGVSSSAVAISIREYIMQEAQMPFVFENVSSAAIRENSDFCNEYYFYPFTSSRQMALAHVDFIQNELPSVESDVDTSQVAMIYADYEAGQEALGLFTEVYEGAGGSVVDEVPAPPGTSDFSNYIPNLESSEADIVHAFLPGVQGIQFASQAADFGLKESKVVALSGDVLNQLSLGAIANAGDGMYGTHWYNSLNESEMNVAYKEWHEANRDTPPNSLLASNVNMFYSLVQGIEAAGSVEAGDLISAMEGMEFDSPFGTLQYRASDHQTEQNFFGFGIEDGWYSSMAEYPDVIGPAMCSFE